MNKIVGKNIIVCCDGTGNEFGATNTNVVKLFAALELGDATKQVGYYDPGVGTGNPRGAVSPTKRTADKLMGLAVGFGLYRNIADAYRYIMKTWEPDDRLYIFGFSRGAYTARALTGFLHMMGLLQPGSDNLIPYALEIYRKKIPGDRNQRQQHFEVAGRFKSTFSRTCNPHFIGVWDTVKTVGWWDALKIKHKWQTALPYTYEMPSVAYGRHAISIDEKRTRFRTNLWQRKQGDNQQQVWFPGVHSDVGGGYKETGLSDIALKWMLIGAQHQDMIVKDGAIDSINPDWKMQAHESYKGAWRLAGSKIRKIRGAGEWDSSKETWISEAPRIHVSARDRYGYEGRIPKDAKYVEDSWDSYQ